jgi:hypothetical protein
MFFLCWATLFLWALDFGLSSLTDAYHRQVIEAQTEELMEREKLNPEFREPTVSPDYLVGPYESGPEEIGLNIARLTTAARF